MKQMIKVVTEEQNLQKIINVLECNYFFYTGGFLYLLLPLSEELSVIKDKIKLKRINNVFVELINDKNYTEQPEIVRQEYKNMQIQNDLQRLEEEQQEYLYNLKQQLLNFQDLLNRHNK